MANWDNILKAMTSACIDGLVLLPLYEACFTQTCCLKLDQKKFLNLLPFFIGCVVFWKGCFSKSSNQMSEMGGNNWCSAWSLEVTRHYPTLLIVSDSNWFLDARICVRDRIYSKIFSQAATLQKNCTPSLLLMTGKKFFATVSTPKQD